MKTPRKYQLQRNGRIFIGIAFSVSLIHLSLGVVAMLSKDDDQQFHLTARSYMENADNSDPSIASNLHKKDLKFLRQNLFRKSNSHLVAKRNILDDSAGLIPQPKDYLNLEGEENALPLKCKSCALVGNLGTLVGSRKGSEIDKNSCIFRIDFSPVRGFEKDVGSRTTARIVDSTRVYPFLKKPEKLVTELYSSEHWFLYNKREGDITRLYSRFLPFTGKYGDTEFLWFTRKRERSALQALKQSGTKLKMKMIGVHPSSLWFAIQIMEDAKCQFVTIYGIPDPKICKRNENLQIKSRYWDPSAPYVCVNGSDAGSRTINKSSLTPQIMGLDDRRGLLSWAKDKSNVFFNDPPWPTYLFS